MDILLLREYHLSENLKKEYLALPIDHCFFDRTRYDKLYSELPTPNKETKELTYLESGCVGMGMVDAIHTIEEGHYEITGNSKLLCYTDGLVEISVGDEVSSTEKMVESCIKTSDPIDQFIESMIDKMKIDKSNPTIFDDITMLGLDFYINEKAKN